VGACSLGHLEVWQDPEAIGHPPPNHSLERTPREARKIRRVALRGRSSRDRYAAKYYSQDWRSKEKGAILWRQKIFDVCLS
jgi:hypothetical protein